MKELIDRFCGVDHMNCLLYQISSFVCPGQLVIHGFPSQTTLKAKMHHQGKGYHQAEQFS